MNETTEQPKRKTHTSTAVKKRYNKKVYSRVYANLPKELAARFKGLVSANKTSTASIIRQAVERYIEENTVK